MVAGGSTSSSTAGGTSAEVSRPLMGDPDSRIPSSLAGDPDAGFDGPWSGLLLMAPTEPPIWGMMAAHASRICSILSMMSSEMAGAC